MRLRYSQNAQRNYKNLPARLQLKADKQFQLLLINYRHPSLKTRKMSGENKFEGRIDRKYRFTFIIEGDAIFILSIGMHDIGLGKK